MENNILKDLFVQKRYDEVIDMLKSLYCDLFVDMLTYKNIDFSNYKKDNFYSMESFVKVNYPCFSDALTYVEATGSNPDNSYLDYINALLSTYILMKDNYKADTYVRNDTVNDIIEELDEFDQIDEVDTEE